MKTTVLWYGKLWILVRSGMWHDRRDKKMWHCCACGSPNALVGVPSARKSQQSMRECAAPCRPNPIQKENTKMKRRKEHKKKFSDLKSIITRRFSPFFSYRWWVYYNFETSWLGSTLIGGVFVYVFFRVQILQIHRLVVLMSFPSRPYMYVRVMHMHDDVVCTSGLISTRIVTVTYVCMLRLPLLQAPSLFV